MADDVDTEENDDDGDLDPPRLAPVAPSPPRIFQQEDDEDIRVRVRKERQHGLKDDDETQKDSRSIIEERRDGRKRLIVLRRDQVG